MTSKTNELKSDSNKTEMNMKSDKEELPIPKTDFTDQTSSSPNTKSKRRTRTTLSIRRSLTQTSSLNQLNATVLTFYPLRTNQRVARVQLLLCNISDRDIFAKLRCNTKSNVSALPASSGHIAAKSQMRIMLNWKMPENKFHWDDVQLPKILLGTYFLHHGQKSTDEPPTNTRLVARISSSKTCDPSDPPIEQLLLDAVGRDTSETSVNQPVSKDFRSPRSDDTTSDKKQADDNKWIALLLIALILILLLTKDSKNEK